MQRHKFLVFLLFCLYAAGALAAPVPEIKEYTLDNGLKLIVRPDSRAPVVTSMVWYRVGSSYEHRGISGVSHVLEHMMFQGTRAHAAGEFSRIIARHGGRENAFTSRDYTGYYQMLAADRLPIAFELEADRMRNLVITDEEFKQEVKVVMEERRLRTEDDPIAKAMERFYYLAYPVNPYRIPIVGWWEDLRSMQVEDLQDWYRRFYAPNNAVVVVAGDVDPEAVLDLAQKTFGKLEPEDLPAVKPTAALQAAGERRLSTELPARVPFLAVGYEAPSLATAEAPWEAYALDVLSALLSGGDSALLPSELVRGKEIAASVSAGYSLASRLDGQFMFTGFPSQGHDLDELEQAVGAVIERLQNEPVHEQALARVKTQLIADHLYQMDSVYYQAMQIGVLETTGIGWRALLDYEDAIKAVTAEQVQAVARKYLRPERSTVLHVQPLAQGDAQ